MEKTMSKTITILRKALVSIKINWAKATLRKKRVASMRNRFFGWLCIFTIFFSVLLAPSAWAVTNLITNGSFEDPPPPDNRSEVVPGGNTTRIPSWETILSGAEKFDPSIYSIGGAQDSILAVDLNPDREVGGGIQQSISTNVGQSYTLFFYGGTLQHLNRNGVGHIEVLIGNNSHTFTIQNLTDKVTWLPLAVTFQAITPDTLIVFKNSDKPEETFSFIDNVYVFSGAPCPSPCEK
jgi:Protein of unknown function (DUF642)